MGSFKIYSYILLRIVVVIGVDDDDLCVWMKAALHPSLSKCILSKCKKCFNVQLKKW